MFPRFCRKYINNTLSITAASRLAVMLLLFVATAFSCSKQKKETVVVRFDAETSYTMRATDVSSLVSDSGITRYRFKTKEWQIFSKAKEPFWKFPQGAYVEKFDSLFQTQASVVADTAYYWDSKGLWKLIGNVEVNNIEGDKFNSELLYWDQKNEKVYSDTLIRIEQEDKIIMGVGFESNSDMTKYKIFKTNGIFPIEEKAQTKADSSHLKKPQNKQEKKPFDLKKTDIPPANEVPTSDGKTVTKEEFVRPMRR